MVESPDQTIAAQVRQIERLTAARNVPSTAAVDLASILDFSNIGLKSEKHALETTYDALITQIAPIAERNSFLEAELVIASRILQ